MARGSHDTGRFTDRESRGARPGKDKEAASNISVFRRCRMVIIGIVGGVASGKSMVAESFRKLGAAVLDADRLGHEVLEEPLVQESLRERWKADVLNAEGRLDRKAIARIVFEQSARGAEQRAFLERVTHPRIGVKVQEALARWQRQADVKVVVLDAPVLLEAGWDRYCDRIVFVDSPLQARQQRARTRGWTEVDFAAREAAQKTLDEKRNCADWVIDNSQSPQHTFEQVQQFWRSLH